MYQHSYFLKEFANDRGHALVYEAHNARYSEARLAARLAVIAQQVGDSLAEWGRDLQARQQERGLQPVPVEIRDSRQNR